MRDETPGTGRGSYALLQACMNNGSTQKRPDGMWLHSSIADIGGSLEFDFSRETSGATLTLLEQNDMKQVP